MTMTVMDLILDVLNRTPGEYVDAGTLRKILWEEYPDRFSSWHNTSTLISLKMKIAQKYGLVEKKGAGRNAHIEYRTIPND